MHCMISVKESVTGKDTRSEFFLDRDKTFCRGLCNVTYLQPTDTELVELTCQVFK